MSELVERLRKQLGDDHVRGCQGRQYSCTCGYDLSTEGLLEIAAARIEALEAALREIGDPLMPHRVDGVGRAWEQATIQAMQKIARAALALSTPGRSSA